jgi:hypothetical protein
VILATIAVAVTMTGCGVVNDQGSAELSYDGSRAEALSLRDAVEQTLSSDAALSSSDDEVRIACGDDAAQFGGTRTIVVAADFDRAGWLDQTAESFEQREGWKVQKKVAADTSSDATTAVSIVSADGYYLRLGEFSTAPQGGPVVVLSASGPCVKI